MKLIYLKILCEKCKNSLLQINQSFIYWSMYGIYLKIFIFYYNLSILMYSNMKMNRRPPPRESKLNFLLRPFYWEMTEICLDESPHMQNLC